MKITVIPSDKIINIDGVSYICDFTFPDNLHAFQWDGSSGHAEWVGANNTEIEYSDVSPYVEIWNAQKAIADAEEKRIKAEREEYYSRYDVKRQMAYPPFADYLDGIVKGDQAQIDKYISDCLAVKNKYPKS